MKLIRPTLDLEDVFRTLKLNGLEAVDREGSHHFWDGLVDGARRVVQIDENDAPFTPASKSLKAIIRDSGIPERLFYSGTGKPLPWG